MGSETSVCMVIAQSSAKGGMTGTSRRGTSSPLTTTGRMRSGVVGSGLPMVRDSISWVTGVSESQMPMRERSVSGRPVTL